MELTAVRNRLVQLIATADALRTEAANLLADFDGDPVDIPRQGRWTRPMLAQLWERVHHLPGVRALFEVTAARPGEVVTYRELLAQSGLAELQQRNEHARLSRISAELFGAKTWPIENWQGSPAPDGGPAEMLYRMPVPVAEWCRDMWADNAGQAS